MQQVSFLSVLIFAFLFLLNNSVWADLKLESPECRTVILSNDGTWHYAKTEKVKSNMAKGGNSADKAYKKIPFNHLKHLLDKKDFQQQKEPFRTSGVAVVIIDTYFLKEDLDDETPIEMNLDNIPKGLVDRLEKSCEDGCSMTLYGNHLIDKEGYQTLIADRIELNEDK